MTAPQTDAPKCIHMTAEMAQNCPACNPGMIDPIPRPDVQLPPPAGYVRANALDARDAVIADLVEALGETVEFFRGDPASDDIAAHKVLDRARAALARATMKQP